MAGDNNLSTAAVSDIGEMMDVGSDSNVTTVILCDRGNGTAIYEVRKGWLKPLKILGNLDTGSPGTLRLFLDEIKKEYTFDKFALVFWDHGDGWEDAAFDDSSHNALKMTDIKNTLKSSDLHLDFLGFDECLSGMAEVFYTFKDISNVTVASEAPEPGFGWDYTSLLYSLDNHSDWDGETFGKVAVDVFYNFYSSYSYFCQPECTLAAVTSRNATDISNTVNNLAFYGLTGSDTLLNEFIAARNNATEPESQYFPFYVDLYSLANNLNSTVSNATVKLEALKLMEEIKGIYFKTTGSSLHGVSIYFPNDTSEYLDNYFNVTSNAFASTLWDDFLRKCYGVLP